MLDAERPVRRAAMRPTSLPALLLAACQPTTPAAAPAAAVSAADQAAAYVAKVDAKRLEGWRDSEDAHGSLETDITDRHEQAASASDEAVMSYLSEAIPEASKYDGLTLAPPVRRQLGLLKVAST